MGDPMKHDRRANARVSAAHGSDMPPARLRPGRTAHVVDLSAGGALIETDCRLMPGARVELHLGEPSDRVAVTGRILRCQVSTVERERIRYRGAVAFERRLPFPGTIDPMGNRDPAGQRDADPARAGERDTHNGQRDQ